MNLRMPEGLTVDVRILLAAATLPAAGFTAEELVVAAFNEFPKDFCLMGFPQYPDSNKVLTQVTTAGRGLQKKGWLTQIGTKKYQLTGEGRRRLESLSSREVQEGIRAEDRDLAEMLLHWLRSEALEKFRIGKTADITEREALAYWRLTSGSSAARAHRVLAVAESAARFLCANVDAGKHTQIHHMRLVSPSQAQQLVNLHEYLKGRFKEALGFLQSQRR